MTIEEKEKSRKNVLIIQRRERERETTKEGRARKKNCFGLEAVGVIPYLCVLCL